jgi:(p)ppGpp synthase/HD superfamily hydrolase
MARVDGAHARMAAVLHDLVEDTEWTLERLREEGFPEDVVTAVDHLTRRDDETYMEFCARAATHPLARSVKLADLADNLDLSRIAEPTDRDRSLMKRYEKARALLLEAEGA